MADLPPGLAWLLAPSSPVAAARRRVLLTWLALSWERVWVRLWLPAMLVVLFAAVALTDILPSLPFLLHTLAVLGAASGIGYCAWHGFKTFSWPTLEDARIALEARSAVAHRPLTATEDTLIGEATPAQKVMWRLHQERALRALAGLRAPTPASDVPRRDPFAMRAIVALVLAVAVIGSSGNFSERLVRALMPMWGADSSTVAVKLWITPPDYTRRSPQYIELPPPDKSKPIGALEIPANSTVLAVVTGTTRATDLTVDKADHPLEKLADQSQRIELKLSPVKRLALRQGFRTLAGWDVTWLPDQPPTIAFAGDPKPASRWRLRIDYKAADDYGLQSIVARINRIAPADTSEVLDVPLSMPPFNPKAATAMALADLAAHPWSGSVVNMQLVATDQAGQTGVSETLVVTLPEREFSHPVAQELAQMRKGLMSDPEGTAPQAHQRLARLLNQPEAYGGDPIVHLSLSTARHRLEYDDTAAAAKTLPDLLWRTAVRIEDGNLDEVEKRLEQAQRALEDAMARNAPSEEISKLIDQLQQAFADYAKELSQRMAKASGEMGTPKNGKVLDTQQLSEMMQQLRELSEMGAGDAAREKFSKLQEMLQAWHNANPKAGDNADMKAAESMMKEFQEITKDQSDLLDQSFEHTRQAAKGEPQQSKPAAEQAAGKEAAKKDEAVAAAEKQQELRSQLNDLLGRIAEMTTQAPDGMGEADSAMRDAADALGQGAWKQGADAQGRALAKLQSGMQQAGQQMMEALMQKGTSGMSQLPGDGKDSFSPNGMRPGETNDDSVEVPTGPDTEGMAQRVRAILDEIRRRASDRTRPSNEQDYLRRLMRQF